jgi:hypothetical protein
MALCAFVSKGTINALAMSKPMRDEFKVLENIFFGLKPKNHPGVITLFNKLNDTVNFHGWVKRSS